MKKFVSKIAIYSVLLLVGLELMVRVFHLHNERPERYLDEFEVEKWVPGQQGISVTGNRRQNIGHYRINTFGFNSVYNNYELANEDNNIALVGDSFIEGFHQDYDVSLGQKVENLLNEEYKVFEFGYAGYDLADQLHLMQQYQKIFNKIDHVIIYMRYTDDLDRDVYQVSNRLSLNTPLNRAIKKVKTIVYMKDIGLFDPVTKKISQITKLIKNEETKDMGIIDLESIDKKRIKVFESLVAKYDYDKEKNILLLDSSLCSDLFLSYVESNGFKILDFSKAFQNSKKPPTLIYDQHWNNHGRDLIANLIAQSIHD